VPETSPLAQALSDRHVIERELGQGGMATVYLAHDVKHDRKVALKVLRPELAAVLGAERFLYEIRVTANLQHPQFLQLLDSRTAVGETGEFLYYVVPYVEGESLRDKLSREKQLSINEALKIASEVADALGSAHRQGVVHWDIKPENILLREGHAVVADFGIALAVRAAGGARLTETGLSLGTPAYMSPEQVAGDRDLDGRSDIYSLACVLYEMLAGDPPFLASTPQAVLAKHMTDPAPPISTVRSSVPKPVAAAVAKALGKARADRYESAKAFSEALFAETTEAEPEVKSIVVLPFENLSPDPEQEYFSDGLTEEVISDLSMVNALQVISRSSAMTFKGSNKKIPDIAKELHVRYALEGSVRKAGNSLRITAQLIDAENDTHVWSGKYTGTLEDVFELQETVSRSVVQALRLKLSLREASRIASRPIDNAQAYDCYLRALHVMESSYTKDALDRGVAYLEDGLALVGKNALLYAGIGCVCWNYANIGVGQEEQVDRAELYARKALEWDPSLPEAHLVLGLVYQAMRGDQRRAFEHLNQSIAANPDDTHTVLWFVVGCYVVGRTDRAKRWLRV
jgi:serine/threonine-protein kinase